MKKFLLFSAVAIGWALPLAKADDSVRAAQAILQSSGYYTGAVSGELDGETKAALRRYQIRNQLEPSGELTPETIAALNKEGSSGTAAAPQPAPTAPPVPATPAVPPSVQPPQAVPGVSMDNPEYSRIFTRTPYENASPEVQVGTVRRAQMILAERGLFRGVPDGRPGPETEEALFRFQASRELPRTGRLDIDTLAELHLLPVSKLQRPRGIQVLPERAAPHGAVRGVPLD